MIKLINKKINSKKRKFTSSMARLSYARVLVEVNLLSNLPYSIEVTLPNGSILHQQVVYETLPRFCKHYRKLGHITSNCTKSQPSNVPSKPRANDSVAPAPNITKGRDTVFNRLGPQGGTSVAGCSEANQPAYCGPNPVPVVDEIVPENGTIMPNNGGWELVRRKKARSKSSQSRNSSGSTHVTPRVGQGSTHVDHCLVHESSPVHAPLHASAASRDHRLPTHPAPNTNGLAGSRKDKGSVHESSPIHAPVHASRDHRLPTHPAPDTNVLAGSQKDKGKAVALVTSEVEDQTTPPSLKDASLPTAPLEACPGIRIYSQGQQLIHMNPAGYGRGSPSPTLS